MENLRSAPSAGSSTSNNPLLKHRLEIANLKNTMIDLIEPILHKIALKNIQIERLFSDSYNLRKLIRKDREPNVHFHKIYTQSGSTQTALKCILCLIYTQYHQSFTQAVTSKASCKPDDSEDAYRILNNVNSLPSLIKKLLPAIEKDTTSLNRFLEKMTY